MRNKSRLVLVLSAASLAYCGGEKKAAQPLFPDAVAENWKRKESAGLPAPDAPESVRRLGLRRAQRAVYEGPGAITADLYELTSSAAGLELVQTWRPAANTVFFYKENYFVVVKWEKAERAAVTAFVVALEKHLGAAR